MNIVFTWNGKMYRVPMKVYEQDLNVKLADGTVLKLLNYAESFPPQPKEIVQVTSPVADSDCVAAVDF